MSNFSFADNSFLGQIVLHIVVNMLTGEAFLVHNSAMPVLSKIIGKQSS